MVFNLVLCKDRVSKHNSLLNFCWWIPTACKAHWTINYVDLLDLNKAFAAQSVAVVNELGCDPSKVSWVQLSRSDIWKFLILSKITSINFILSWSPIEIDISFSAWILLPLNLNVFWAVLIFVIIRTCKTYILNDLVHI